MSGGIIRAQPQKGYDVHYYNATIQLDRLSDSMWGQVTMMATAVDSIVGILQQEKFLVLDSVFLNGVRTDVGWSPDTTDGSYSVAPSTLIPAGSQFQVLTYYHGKGMPEQNSYAWGGVTDKDTMMFALGVGFANSYTGCTRHWLPCYDLPDDKADSVDLTFICPASEVTASNGLLVSNLLTPGGERIMHWHESHPIATYLLTFATGPFTEQDIPNVLGVPFEVFALASDSIAAAAEMHARVAPILAFYDSLFAPYPFEKVGYVATPIGSMESQTMIELDKAILDADSASDATDTSENGTTAIHELSHQWWGDRVTCNTFDDAWLNEGFAKYCESLVLERLFGREKYISRQRSNVASAKSLASYPLFGAATFDHHTDNYPTAIYSKGAAVLGMLRQYLGDSIFFQAIRYYGNTHAYSTVTSYDLWNDFDTVSGQDLGWFFQPWVFGTGYPKDTVLWSKTASGASITFHQAKNNSATPYFRMPIPVEARTSGGQSKTVTVWMDSSAQSSAPADFGFTPDTLIFDPDGLLVMRIVRVTQTASSVAPVGDGEAGQLRLRAFPNPDSQNMLQIMLDAPQAMGMVSLTLADENGKIVRRFEEAMPTGNRAFSMSLAGLSGGNYILYARSTSGNAMQKISIAN
ncbi:MAG TPA: M1 family aminopeptidase, partial [Candidatus Kapabacteria bacterium]|nr:M1 family aminopeptidase [Candidatus Kapabacteria bacterium]